MKILERTYLGNSEDVVCTIICKGRKFEKIPLKRSKERNCYRNCVYKEGCFGYKNEPLRFLDCEKRKITVSRIWNVITVVPLLIFLYFCLKVWDIGILKTVAFGMIGIVIMDVFCCLIAKFIPKFREQIFFNKLVKLEKRKLAKQEQEEEEDRQRTEKAKQEKRAKNPYYEGIEFSTKCVDALKVLSDQFDFGNIDSKIEKCVDEIEAILAHLEQDNSGYPRVRYLLRTALPEFLTALNLFTNYIKAEHIPEDEQKRLADTVDVFCEFVEKNKVDVIHDTVVTDMNFSATADTLRNILQGKMEEEKHNV